MLTAGGAATGELPTTGGTAAEELQHALVTLNVKHAMYSMQAIWSVVLEGSRAATRELLITGGAATGELVDFATRRIEESGIGGGLCNKHA